MKAAKQVVLVACMLVAPAVAQKLPDAPPPPPLPEEGSVPPPPVPNTEPQGDGNIATEADVTIRREADQTIEEYRRNGKLYMVKVIPDVGKPYYLVYPDQQGGLPTRHELGDIQTPHWKVKEW